MGRVIAAPQDRFAQGRNKGPQAVGPRRVATADVLRDAAVREGEGGFRKGRKRTGLRLTFRGGVPETTTGRVLAGVVGLLLTGAAVLGLLEVRRVMGRDQRFMVPGASAIETVGLEHVGRDEVLRVLGDGVGRNIFRLSLPAQQAGLERMPWVESATVMRLLPDRLRAEVRERTPVAFAREKGKIGLVDSHGVLLDLRQPPAGGSYSFPVVTGVGASETPAERAQRMKLFGEFIGALDATGESISAKLSEIDLSNPEDVRALIPDSGSEVLVHFGDANYLERYRSYEAHLPEWKQQYPKLASVDMRYERQAVLEMAPGSAVPVNEAVNAAKTIPVPAPKPGGARPMGARAVVGKGAGHGLTGRGLTGHGPAGHGPAVVSGRLSAAARGRGAVR